MLQAVVIEHNCLEVPAAGAMSCSRSTASAWLCFAIVMLRWVQVRQNAVRMLTTFSVQCQVSALGGARRRLLKDASHRALPVAVVADDIDILLVQVGQGMCVLTRSDGLMCGWCWDDC
jgi:hypothetical protein